MNWRRWLVWFLLLLLELVLSPILFSLLFWFASNDWTRDLFFQLLHYFDWNTAEIVFMVGWMAVMVLLTLIRGFVKFCMRVYASVLIASLLVQEIRNQFSDFCTISPTHSTSRCVWTPFSNESSRWFYQVTMCNFSPLDDPFWPYASIVHIVEIRRHSFLWDEIVLWKVSTFNGTRHFVHNVNVPFGPFLYYERHVACFQSDGLIGVFLSWAGELWPFDLWYFYDTRTNHSSMYTRVCLLASSLYTMVYVSMSCEKRIRNPDGSIAGWRVRLISGYTEGIDPFNHNAPVKKCLVNSVIDLDQKPVIWEVSREEVAFNTQSWELGGVVRTSDDSFGLYTAWVNSGSVMLHSHKTNGYTFTTVGRLWKDRRFSTCFSGVARPADAPETADNASQEEEEWSEESDSLESVSIPESVSYWPMDRYQPLRPMVLNEYECLKLLEDGTILRATFQPPSLKYRAMQEAVMNGLIPRGMSAREFQNLIGVDSMPAHFEKTGKKKTHCSWPGFYMGSAPKVVV